ncbi:hypothetical protein C8Q79DRAFT_997479 [Trametes meyenii]|nr:hypothetical protein C8Q79DRAFT_997479 [Trametes meyenii]
MPTTRGQEAAEKHNLRTRQPAEDKKATAKPASKSKKPPSSRKSASPKKSTVRAKEEDSTVIGEKRDPEPEPEENKDEPPAKKVKAEEQPPQEKSEVSEGVDVDKENAPAKHHPGESMVCQQRSVTVVRCYRARPRLFLLPSQEDVQRFYMVLVPRPPQFAASSGDQANIGEEDQEMNLIESGADAVPAPEAKGQSRKWFRLLIIGKKGLPDPDAGGGGKGGGRKQVFWATVGSIGDDLKKLEEGLGAKVYETKTRGTRHQRAARLAARGAYAIVNNEAARTPSQRETHFGYHLSHPDDEHFGEVQETLGIHKASSFVLQVKNPLAPPSGPGQVGLPKGRRAEFPEEILKGVFGKGGQRGRELYGLRFASVERRELLDYEGAELLFIAARSGEQGLETSLGDGRGHALEEVEKREGKESMDEVMKELAMDDGKIPVDPLEGEWA